MNQKHIIGTIFCIAVISVLLSAMPFLVSAQADDAHADHAQCIPIRTDRELSQMQAGQSYYLDADITVSAPVRISGSVSLCLNGMVLRYENAEETGSLFVIGKDASLSIFDCSEQTRFCTAGTNGLWSLTEEESTQTVKGGVILGGTGEKREIAELDSTYSCGGFAYVDGGSLLVYGGNILGNQADYGGAVYMTGDGRLEIDGGKFYGNLSRSRGGAVFVHSGTMLLQSGVISANKSVKNGGGVDISGESILEMHGGLVTGNTAGAWSGGIENFGKFDLYGGEISANSAGEDAGGIYNGGFLTMHGGSVRENSAKYGGGICNDGKMTVHDGYIFANLAQESGGGIYNADTLVINGGRISANTAVTSGGGIENDGFCTMYGGVIGGSVAEEANMAYLGGGVCVYSGRFTMYGGRIEKNTGIDGGGVENEASFFMYGGSIVYNYAAVQGGGITNRGQLLIGGESSVTSNASGTDAEEAPGGGVYWIATETSSVGVAQRAQITGNTTNGVSANLVICGKGIVSVSDADEAMQIGFTLLNANKRMIAGKVASLSESDEIRACFTSDHEGFVMQMQGDSLSVSEKNADWLIGACVTVAVVLSVAAVAVGIRIRKRRRR